MRQQSLEKVWEDSDKVQYKELLWYVPEVFRTEFISKHHDNPLARHFKMNKTMNLIAPNYYWLIIWADIEIYVKDFDVCLASELGRDKSYEEL